MIVQDKRDVFGRELIRLAGFSLRIAENFCASRDERLGPAAHPAGVYRQSAMCYNGFCERVDKAFITPLDRRDLLEMAAGFYRLTGRLSLLSPPVPPEAAANLVGLCRSLQAALEHWQPLGGKTNATAAYLQKAGDFADKGIRAAGRSANWPGTKAAMAKAVVDLIHLEDCFRCGSDQADLIRRVQIQNG